MKELLLAVTTLLAPIPPDSGTQAVEVIRGTSLIPVCMAAHIPHSIIVRGFPNTSIAMKLLMPDGTPVTLPEDEMFTPMMTGSHQLAITAICSAEPCKIGIRIDAWPSLAERPGESGCDRV